MTRLRERPIVRVVAGSRGDMVAVFTGRTLVLRPKRSRRAESTVSVNWDAIYVRALLAQAPKRRARRTPRGVL